jgi:hypothetical protein
MGCLASALFKHVLSEVLEAFDEHGVTFLICLYHRMCELLPITWIIAYGARTCQGELCVITHPARQGHATYLTMELVINVSSVWL